MIKEICDLCVFVIEITDDNGKQPHDCQFTALSLVCKYIATLASGTDMIE